MKPSVMHKEDIESIGILKRRQETIYQDSDVMIIEDDSGWIKVGSSEKLNPSMFLTGSVVALLGQINQNGIFEAEDYTFASYPKQEKLIEGVDMG